MAPAAPAAAKDDMDEDPAMAKAKLLLESQKTRTPDQIVKEEGVPQNVYLEYIKQELESEQACLELPFTILILLSFSFLAIMVLDQPKVFAVEKAFWNDIMWNTEYDWMVNYGGKTLPDVHTVRDFYSMFRTGYIPLVVQQAWAVSEAWPPPLGPSPLDAVNYTAGDPAPQWYFPGYDQQPAPIRNDYLRYHRMIGGLRLRQQVAPSSFESCRLPLRLDRPAIEAWLGKPCSVSDMGEHSPEPYDVEQYDGFERYQWLWTELDTVAELKRTVIEMEDGCQQTLGSGLNASDCRCKWCREQDPPQPWIDERTKRVELSWFSYNPQYGLYSYVAVNLFLNRGGAVQKLMNIMSAWADPESAPVGDRLPKYIAAIIWITSLLYITVTELKEIIDVLRNSKMKIISAMQSYLGVWNAVDWISIGLGMVIVILYFRMRSDVGAVNSLFSEMMVISQSQRVLPPSAPRDAYQAATETFFLAGEKMIQSEKAFRIGTCLYPGVLMLRLFKSFANQPRLAVVTATLTRAAPDLLHFFVVFLCVYACMVVNSILLFGRDIESFSTLPRAINTCFLAMFGDRDWEAMQDIGFLKAAIWYWTFMLVMVLMLLNMLLAIIMDAYTAEKEKASNAQTIVAQVLDMRRRRIQFKRGERVRLNDIWDAFKSTFGDEQAMLENKQRLSVEMLVSMVPRLQHKQAHRLLVKSLEHQQRIHEGTVTDEDIMAEIKQKLKHIETRSDEITDQLSYVVDQVHFFDHLQAPGDNEYDLHFTPAPQSDEKSMNQLAEEINQLLGHSLAKVEVWQDNFEKRQDELHELMVEMQLMVQQQAAALAAISEATSLLGDEHTEFGPVHSLL